ncbi:Molecular chaperone IbpA, HSP20 family [Halogranum amylolyticum]|uniref:Molecular chaperone IbpA, HSP20 family n=1 Tax=Halogranum amylolyticum TaxID=660520 RepID=A0A1H8PKG5_9EURY|nr:Hsp20 family protein [Halogranum amylolyticum]SEO42276.1 Molecular chaperone IbpA, HSP20 family [Halogranum amylolyticum]
MSGLREFGKSAFNAVLDRAGRGMSKVQERKPLSYDLLESDDAYLVVFDAPGATQSDLQVRFLDGEVQVRIDRFRDFYEGFEMRFPGRGLSLDGSARLPDDADVDPGRSSATLTKTGTLQVRIPKSETAHDVQVQEEDDDVERIGLDDEDEGEIELEDAENEEPVDLGDETSDYDAEDTERRDD